MPSSDWSAVNAVRSIQVFVVLTFIAKDDHMSEALMSSFIYSWHFLFCCFVYYHFASPGAIIRRIEWYTKRPPLVCFQACQESCNVLQVGVTATRGRSLLFDPTWHQRTTGAVSRLGNEPLLADGTQSVNFCIREGG